MWNTLLVSLVLLFKLNKKLVYLDKLVLSLLPKNLYSFLCDCLLPCEVCLGDVRNLINGITSLGKANRT